MARLEILLMRGLALALLALALTGLPGLLRPEDRLTAAARTLPPDSAIRQEALYRVRSEAAGILLLGLTGGLILLGLAGIRQDQLRLWEALEEE